MSTLPLPSTVASVASGLGWLAVLGLLILLLRLEQALGRAPRLQNRSGPGDDPGSDPHGEGDEGARPELIVIVPTFNEAATIEGCLSALLASELPQADWRVIVADDDSTDGTTSLVEADRGRGDLAQGVLELLRCGPRPQGERWCGKTWPCSEAVRHLATAGKKDDRWLLFLDADVTVGPMALAAALAEARRSGADLLSLAPKLECGCLAEWLVQPIVSALLGLGFPIDRANDPDDPTAFAAGPFMLFRRSAYERIGGHRAVAAEVVEDLALARAIKHHRLRLRYLLGLDLLSLRMYRSTGALWEGWTKNWYLGLNRNAPLTLASGAVVLLLFSGPWLLLPLAPGPAVLGIALQLAIRIWSRWRFGLGLRHWWLGGLGGLMIAAIAPVSIWKTSTGQGWTWKGRSLAETPG